MYPDDMRTPPMSNVHYLEAPRDIQGASLPENTVTVFMAGGITDCPDWQTEVAAKMNLLAGYAGDSVPNILLMNPRRINFPIGDPDEAPRQIRWGYKHLRYADIISFWFSSGAIQPITLFEYGYWLGQDKPLVVGCDPTYPRLQDVVIQTRLKDPGIIIHNNLDNLCAGILQQARMKSA